MCQHYGKLCTRFHAEQARYKIYESGVLKGIKTYALNTVPNKGRIIGQKEKDYLKKLEEEMKNDPWYVKLKLWFNLQKWVLMCRTRKYWDKTYQHYIFRKNED